MKKLYLLTTIVIVFTNTFALASSCEDFLEKLLPQETQKEFHNLLKKQDSYLSKSNFLKNKTNFSQFKIDPDEILIKNKEVEKIFKSVVKEIEDEIGVTFPENMKLIANDYTTAHVKILRTSYEKEYLYTVNFSKKIYSDKTLTKELIAHELGHVLFNHYLRENNFFISKFIGNMERINIINNTLNSLYDIEYKNIKAAKSPKQGWNFNVSQALFVMQGLDELFADLVSGLLVDNPNSLSEIFSTKFDTINLRRFDFSINDHSTLKNNSKIDEVHNYFLYLRKPLWDLYLKKYQGNKKGFLDKVTIFFSEIINDFSVMDYPSSFKSKYDGQLQKNKYILNKLKNI